MMDLNGDTPALRDGDAPRLDVRGDLLELARPVAADGLVAVDAPAFPGIRPIHIRIHRCQHRIDVAAIERVVEREQEALIVVAREATTGIEPV
jgi:hypothetical protein